MSNPIITDAETFCIALHSSIEKFRPQGKITAGDLLLAVEKLNFDTGDLKNKALTALRSAAEEAKKGAIKGTVLDSRLETIQLIANLYEEASRTARKTDRMTELGVVLTKEAGISPITREVVKVATERFARLETGKSYAEAGPGETIRDLWTRMKTKILELLTYLRHLPSYSHKKDVEEYLAQVQKAFSKVRSNDDVKSILHDVADRIKAHNKVLREYLGVKEPDLLLHALEQRLIKLKICTQDQIDKGFLLNYYDGIMERLQKKDPVLYAYMVLSQELTMFVAEPELYTPEQRKEFIQALKTKWTSEFWREKALNNIKEALTLGAPLLADFSENPISLTGVWESVALTDLIQEIETESPFLRASASKGEFTLNQLLSHRYTVEKSLTEYFNQHP